MAPTLTIHAMNKSKPTKQRKKQFTSGATRTPWVNALVDPFTADAVQLPDEYAGGTVALKIVEDYTCTLSAAGDLIVALSPSLARSYYTTTVAAGAVTASTYSQHPDYTDFAAQFTYARTLLMAVEVSYIGSELDNQGRLALACTPQVEYVATGATVASLFDDAFDALPLRDGALIVSRPVQPPRFELTSTAALGFGTIPTVNIAVLGGKASATCVSVRCIKFVEAQPAKGSLHRGSMTVEPYDPHTMAIAANMAMNEPPVHPNTDGGKLAIKRESKELAEAAADWLISAAVAAGIPGAAGARVVYDVAKTALVRRKSK